MHRFTTKETKHTDQKRRLKLWYIFLPLLIVAFYFMASSVNESTIERQKDSLQNAINKDIIHCYAVEGFYPPSLTYIKEHYGLTYNEELFTIDYQPIASNLRPDVTILEIGK
ncbi:MAG: hypothetical protein MJZ11_06395 [Lachnospiraceae bacterium]|nr:hypothetical protein [Lachnospiraceae bacterium]